MADRDDLNSALEGLSQLAMGTSLFSSLARIATFAAQAIPGADGAGVTMLEPGRPETVATSAPFVKELDDIQYGLGEGPCVTAATDGLTVRSGDLGAEREWSRFGPRARALGVHSVLSLPLMIGDDVLGALNVYARPRAAFSDEAVLQGELFAVPAAVAVHNARVLMQAQRLAEQLQSALSSRAIIDQAIGIVMSRQGGTADDAFNGLRSASQRDNIKLATVAQGIVDEAVRRARARRAQFRPAEEA
jgi:GAF domain-containing protein